MLQVSFNRRAPSAGDGRNGSGLRKLDELSPGQEAVLERLDLPAEDARRLMELGFLPGHPVVPAMAAPGGDPRVFRVDGSEIALRSETASRLIVRCAPDRQRKSA